VGEEGDQRAVKRVMRGRLLEAERRRRVSRS